MNKIIVGVDPGHPPQLACLLVDEFGYEGGVASCRLMEFSYDNDVLLKDGLLCPHKIARLIQRWRKSYGVEKVSVVAEKVSMRKGEGTVSAVKYLASFYVIQGLAAGLTFEFESVHPRTWKSWSDKQVSLDLAAKEWPNFAAAFAKKKSHNKAEAALIGLWKFKGKKLTAT